jgi:hypothetical protein
MYMLLLAFGVVLTIAGLILAASGVSIHDRTFDMTIATPGIVAVVGGLALVGLGMALRVLQRIEHGLTTPPMPRAARPGETAELAAATDRAGEAARIPLPPKILSRTQVAPAAVPAPAAEKRPQDLPGKTLGRLPEKSPVLGRPETTTVIEEIDLALSARAPATSVDAAVGQFDKMRAARSKNGGSAPGITPQPDTVPRFDLGVRSPVTTQRPKGPAFGTLWPKSPRPVRVVQPASNQAAAAELEPEQVNEPEREAAPGAAPEAAQEISILKSGVVDGMAYTLFSDGSIEAELPQGKLRFGSITELRNHIEQTA